MKLTKLLFCLSFIMCLFTTNAYALVDVAINNNSKADISFAVSYLDSRSQKWVTEGWYNIKPQEHGIIKVDTDNSLVYLYGESSNGKKIEGGAGSVELLVSSKSFFYFQDQGFTAADSKAKFMRASVKNNKVVFTLN